MPSVFDDQARFMQACGQSVGTNNEHQYVMYYTLIKEEVAELMAAERSGDRVERLDALIDILVVTIGAIHSMGADAEGAWNEVMRSNFDKIDPVTGSVTKRGDGKVLKPEGWKAPELSSFVGS
jgi:predicted HAD superfamily Cof-like phosphohydrolase